MATPAVIQLEEFKTPKPLSQDEKLYGQKKCLRCNQYYTESTNTECNYHSGDWSEVNFSNVGILSSKLIIYIGCRRWLELLSNERSEYVPFIRFE